MKTFSYNDGISSRNRRPELIIYTSSEVWMGTASIPGVATVTAVDFHKNGKWSSTDYQVTLAEGVQAVVVRQDFSTGKWFSDRCLSWAAVGKELGLEGVSPKAVEAAVRENWPNHAARFDERRAALIELEESGSGTVSSQIVWEKGFNTRRIGEDVLLVDGQLFTGESIPGKVIVLATEGNGQGGRYSVTTYTLEVAEGVELECLTEGGFPGDDSLEERGWTFDGSTWNPPSTSNGGEGSLDLSALGGLKF